MNVPFIQYKNFDRGFFRFITIIAFDRQTDGRKSLLAGAQAEFLIGGELGAQYADDLFYSSPFLTSLWKVSK